MCKMLMQSFAMAFFLLAAHALALPKQDVQFPSFPEGEDAFSATSVAIATREFYAATAEGVANLDDPCYEVLFYHLLKTGDEFAAGMRQYPRLNSSQQAAITELADRARLIRDSKALELDKPGFHRGHVGSMVKHSEALGGFYPSSNFSRAIPRQVQAELVRQGVAINARSPDQIDASIRRSDQLADFAGASQLDVIVRPEDVTLYDDGVRGVAAYLINPGPGYLALDVLDSDAGGLLMARDADGDFKRIEKAPDGYGFCGNSRHQVFLEPGRCWKIALPQFEGKFPTSLKVRTHWLEDEAMKFQDSNEFPARIDPRQLVVDGD